MDVADRTPILVGAAALQQKEIDPADPNAAREPLELMIDAAQAAAADCTAADILRRATSVRAPRGFWDYPDPCRLIAERSGAARARTEIAEIGVLQTTVIGRAARDIADGKDDVVLLVGAEARNRSRLCGKLGVEERLTAQDEGTAPDHVLEPAEDVISEIEIHRGLAWPVNQYALIENAIRAAESRSVDSHRDQIADLWSRFNAVAAANPHAWNRQPASHAEIRGDSGVKMLAFPYTKLHTSQWNVDQAAALILTSAGLAGELGIERERWIFPWAVVDSNLMLPLSQRREPHRCVGFCKAAARIEQRTGTAIADATYLELYSCFPSAVRLQMREMGIPADRDVTVTGGMAYAGGPLNNFVLQGLARLAELLRGDRGSSAALTAVSGMLTKQGVSLWSTEPPTTPFFFDDVSSETEAETAAVEVIDDAAGEATIVTYTVLAPDSENQIVALVELDDGRRTVIAGPAPAGTSLEQELIGRRIRIRTPDQLSFL